MSQRPSPHRYCVRVNYGEAKIGPVRRDQLTQLCRSGHLTPRSMVRECGAEHHWHRADSVPQLAVLFAIRDRGDLPQPAEGDGLEQSLPRCLAMCSQGNCPADPMFVPLTVPEA